MADGVGAVVSGEASRGEAVASARPRGADFGAYLDLALMVLISSSTAPAAKFAVRELPPGLLPLVRFGVAGLCLLPLVGFRGGLARMVRDDGWRLLAAAALCVPVNQTFFLNGTRLTPTSHTALIYALCPLVVLFLASASGQERLVAGRLVGVLASVLGVVVIGLDSLARGGAGGQSTLLGDLFLVAAVASWGAYLTASKPLIARHGPLTALTGTFLAGAALQLPLAVATWPGWPALAGASSSAWGGLAYLTLVVTAVGLAFLSRAMNRLDASQVATAGNAAPLLTITWGVWLLGESVNPALALGGVLTLGGILWASRPPADRST
jgi:drug/metabolite transporter (DMT)-like permease